MQYQFEDDEEGYRPKNRDRRTTTKPAKKRKTGKCAVCNGTGRLSDLNGRGRIVETMCLVRGGSGTAD